MDNGLENGFKQNHLIYLSIINVYYFLTENSTEEEKDRLYDKL